MSDRNRELAELLVKAKAAFDSMSPEEQREHRIQQAASFAFGNLALDGSKVTYEQCLAAAREHYKDREP